MMFDDVQLSEIYNIISKENFWEHNVKGKQSVISSDAKHLDHTMKFCASLMFSSNLSFYIICEY